MPRATLALALLVSACGPSREDTQARLATLEAEGDALTHAADALEERLLADHVRVSVWRELAERHKDVSEIACRNSDAHYDGMVRFLEEQEEKARGLKRHRVAALGWEGPAPREPRLVAAGRARADPN